MSFEGEDLKRQRIECNACRFVMPSETSPTHIRCGLSYFNANPLLKKMMRMDHFPVVKSTNACESWSPAKT